MKFEKHACDLARTTENAVVNLHTDLLMIKTRARALLAKLIIGLGDLRADDEAYVEECVAKRLKYALDEIDDALTDLYMTFKECEKVLDNE